MMLANPDQSLKLAWLASSEGTARGRPSRLEPLRGREKRRRPKSTTRTTAPTTSSTTTKKAALWKSGRESEERTVVLTILFFILKGRSNVSLLDQRDLRTFLMFDGCREIFRKIDEVC